MSVDATVVSARVDRRRGGGTYLEKGYRIYGGKDPLFTLLRPLHKTLFQLFSVPQDPIITENQHISQYSVHKMPKFGKLLVSKPKNWLKIYFRKPHFGGKISSASSIDVKTLFSKFPNSVLIKYIQVFHRAFQSSICHFIVTPWILLKTL